MYVLDTCIIEYLGRPKNDEMRKAVEAWFTGVDESELYISVATVIDQRKNVEHLRRKADRLVKAVHLAKKNTAKSEASKIENKLTNLIEQWGNRILSLDTEGALRWASMLGTNKVEANTDHILASIAWSSDFVVVTANVKDFRGQEIRVLDPTKANPQATEI